MSGGRQIPARETEDNPAPHSPGGADSPQRRSTPALRRFPVVARSGFPWRLGFAVGVLLLVCASVQIARLDLENERERSAASQARARADELVDFMLFELRDRLAPVGRTELLEQPARKALAYLDSVRQADDSAETRHRRGVALDNVGQTLAERGDLPAAERAFRQALEIAERLSREQPGNVNWQRGLAIGHSRIGDLLQERGDLAGALAQHRQALEILDRLARQQPDDRERQYDLGLAHERVGSVLQAQGEFSQALKQFQARQILVSSLHTLDPDHPVWRRDLAMSFGAIGDIYEASGDAGGALAAYRRFAELAEQGAAQYPDQADFQHDLAISQEKLGDSHAARGDLAAAGSAYRRLADISARLAALDPNNVQHQRDLAAAHSRLAAVAEKQGRTADAIELQRQTAESLTDLAKRLGTVGARRDAGDAWGKLAWYSLLQRKPDRAAAAAQQGLQLSPDEPRIMLNLAHALMLGGRMPEAERLYRQTREAMTESDRSWNRTISDDFAALTAKGIVHPEMRRVTENLKFRR